MDLKPVVDENKVELFLAMDESGNFYPWAKARLSSVDRFLSNFHRPLQRRMLFTLPSDELPASGVIKLEATDEIYIIGESRLDTDALGKVDRLTVLHIVSNTSSDLCNYTNYHIDLADTLAVNPYNIGKFEEGEFYISVEYVSTKSSESGDEAYQGKFIAFSSAGTPFKRDGFFSVGGRAFKVIEAYFDSGFSCAIVIEQEDDMVVIIHKKINAQLSGYDVVTGIMTIGYIDHAIAGTIDRTEISGGGTIKANVYLKGDISSLTGSVVGQLIVTPDGHKLKVMAKVTDNNTQGQLLLSCEGN